MPCVTYLGQFDVEHFAKGLTNEGISELLLEVNRNGEHWAVQELQHIEYRWFRQKTVKLYAVYRQANEVEWQCINFADGLKNSSITMLVDAASVCNYLKGYIDGRYLATLKAKDVLESVNASVMDVMGKIQQ